jgi:hypothetical protein
MRFHDYFTMYQFGKSCNPRIDHTLAAELRKVTIGNRRGVTRLPDCAAGYIANRYPREEFFRRYVNSLEQLALDMSGKQLHEVDPFTPVLAELEHKWQESGRPYYNLWPSIIEPLCKLNLDADASLFTLPLDELLVRFPDSDANPLRWSWGGTEWQVRSVLCQNAMLFDEPGGTKWVDEPPSHKRGIALWIDCGEPAELGLVENVEAKPVSGAGHMRRLMYKHILCEEGHSIEWSFTQLPSHNTTDFGVQYPDEIVMNVARIVGTLCIMSGDEEIVEPIVLARDSEKFRQTQDQKFIVRAKQRGVFGFDVGKAIEVSPHVRSPHPALFWTGVGRKIPQIRFRRGSVVHRKKLGQLPTGYLDKEGEAK